MIYSYGVSLPGTYHIKNDIVCQDWHQIIRCGRKMAIAAVADGLGSAAHSDVGSKIAAAVSAEYCKRHITMRTMPELALRIIRDAFVAAQRVIKNVSEEKGHSIDLYDTTLTLAVLIRDTLYYGHSGDSGMIALTAEGRYEQVTQQQRDEEGRVFPLFFSDKWEFARYGKKVASVFLATDGMLETLFPLYIKNEPVNIHVSLAQFFMDNSSLRIDKEGEQAVKSRISDFMENIPDEQVNDDKTVVVLVNTAVKPKRQPEEYYIEPDWDGLRKKHEEAWKRAAYPGLFKDEQGGEPSENDEALSGKSVQTKSGSDNRKKAELNIGQTAMPQGGLSYNMSNEAAKDEKVNMAASSVEATAKRLGTVKKMAVYGVILVFMQIAVLYDFAYELFLFPYYLNLAFFAAIYLSAISAICLIVAVINIFKVVRRCG